ncbi:hypothetical protein BH09ACT10_BH09ACT10_25440 [soil metagenome]
MRMLLGAVGVCAALGLSACSTGGSGGSATPDPTASPSISAGPVQVEDGVAASQDLNNFLCAPLADGTWAATGSVTNSTDVAADYRVTVFAGVANAPDAAAQSVVLSGVAPGKAAPFAVPKVPTSGAAPQCFAKVVRLS